ncbi:hypothetical protein GCM10011588_30940 [Nocardia jinanensis]|uniref:Helix-turn-helix domain-containing protein n=1 Tax=Nocardia jinanensis TaxID=382504 RepID=A0A917RMI2_9NOCA|nr:hypothetical protein GCM10011588_30940 [Nocardia jinanensis]
MRELVPELQQRALRHSTADFIRHHALSTLMPALTLAEAETGQYGSDVDLTRPDGPADRTARLAGLLGVPAPAVANQIDALERNGSLDPIRELLQPAGIAPAAAEALRQHVEATAPATTLQRALFTDEQALNHMIPLRDRLAAELGLPIADVDGAEGMRTLDPALTEARDALAAALGYPVAGINPGVARDILGEAVGDHLPAVHIAESDVRDDTAAAAADSGPLGHDSQHGTSQDAAAQKSDTQNSDVDRGTADDIVAAASRYLALSALLDSVVQIHRRSPNSCVNNAVTGMRVLCPDNAGRFRAPPTNLEGYGRDTVRDIFGAGLEETGSLDEVVESLKSRPGGISVLVYKWKDTRANGTSTEADDHMVLLVNDSTSVDQPNLVVVDLAASRDRNTENDYGPRDLRSRRTLLNRAVGFDDWRREQEVFINRMPAEERRFETIEFDRDGNLVSGSRTEAPDAENLPPSQRVDVPSAMQDEINAIPVGQPGLDEAMFVRSGAAGDISNDTRRDEFRPAGSRPHDGPDHITDNPGPTPASARPTANTTPGSAAAASGNPAQPNTPAANNAPPGTSPWKNRAATPPHTGDGPPQSADTAESDVTVQSDGWFTPSSAAATLLDLDRWYSAETQRAQAYQQARALFTRFHPAAAHCVGMLVDDRATYDQIAGQTSRTPGEVDELLQEAGAFLAAMASDTRPATDVELLAWLQLRYPSFDDHLHRLSREKPILWRVVEQVFLHGESIDAAAAAQGGGQARIRGRLREAATAVESWIIEELRPAWSPVPLDNDGFAEWTAQRNSATPNDLKGLAASQEKAWIAYFHWFLLDRTLNETGTVLGMSRSGARNYVEIALNELRGAHFGRIHSDGRPDWLTGAPAADRVPSADDAAAPPTTTTSVELFDQMRRRNPEVFGRIDRLLARRYAQHWHQVFQLAAHERLGPADMVAPLGVSKTRVFNWTRNLRARAVELYSNARPQEVLLRMEWLEAHYGPLDRFVDQLPADQQRVFTACYGEGLGHTTIAEQQQTSRKVVADRMLTAAAAVETAVLREGGDRLIADIPDEDRGLSAWLQEHDPRFASNFDRLRVEHPYLWQVLDRVHAGRTWQVVSDELGLSLPAVGERMAAAQRIMRGYCYEEAHRRLLPAAWLGVAPAGAVSDRVPRPDIGGWLTEYRRESGKNQSEFAGGRYARRVMRYQRGDQIPRPRYLRDLLDMHNVSPVIARRLLMVFYGGRGVAWYDPAGAFAPPLDESDSITEWLIADRRYLGKTTPQYAGRLNHRAVQFIESGANVPRMRTLRLLAEANGWSSEVLHAAVRKRFEHVPETAEPEEAELFWRLVDTPVDEEQIDEIVRRYLWIVQAVLGRGGYRARPDYDDVFQICSLGLMRAIGNHAPWGAFVPYAWAFVAMEAWHATREIRFANLNPRDRNLVLAVRAELARLTQSWARNEEHIPDSAVAERLEIAESEVSWVRRVAGVPSSLDEPDAVRESESRGSRLGDDTAQVPFDSVVFGDRVQQALEDLPDPVRARQLVVLHFMRERPLSEVAERIGLSLEDAKQLFVQVVDRLRESLADLAAAAQIGPFDDLADEGGPSPGPAENRTGGAPDSIGSKPSHSAADSSSPNSANALSRARGAWITARRDDKGRRDGRTMTAADLAGAVDVDPSTMSRIERGSTRPRPGLFVKIGRALGVPRSEFVDIARNVYPDADFDLAPAAYPLDAPGRWLSAMLHDRDMSWNELVEASGISAKYLNSIGKGETVPGAAVFLSLCQELNLGAEAIGTAADRFFPGTPADLAPTAYAREERGLWLRAQRNDHGISDEELAQAAGIGTERLRSVERAERELGVVDFLSVCKALGLGREAIDTAADRFFPGVRVGLDPAAYAPEEHGLWLRALRYDRGISPEEVAEAAGISTTHLRSIETGERAPGVVVFLSLCDALGIETDVTGRAAGRFYPEARFDLDRTAYTSGEQGLWFRALRYHYRLQRSDVADDTGLTDRYIGQIERGERIPSRRAFRLLGRELGIGPIDLDAAEDHFSASALTDGPGLRFDDLTAGNEAQADLVERQIVGLLEGWSDPAYVREIAAAVGASIRWGQGPISLRAELDADAVHVDLVDITGDHSYVRVEWRLGRTPGPVERAAEPPVERSSEEIDLDRLMEMYGESAPEEIPPYQREVRRIRNAVEARLLEYDADVSVDVVDSIMRAVSELVTNAKKHLYSNASSAGLAPEEVLDLAIRVGGDDEQVHIAVTNDIAPGVAAKLPKWTADEQSVDREGGRGTQLVIAESTVAVRRIIFANGKNTIEHSVEFHATPPAGDVAVTHSRSTTRKPATIRYTTTGRFLRRPVQEPADAVPDHVVACAGSTIQAAWADGLDDALIPHQDTESWDDLVTGLTTGLAEIVDADRALAERLDREIDSLLEPDNPRHSSVFVVERDGIAHAFYVTQLDGVIFVHDTNVPRIADPDLGGKSIARIRDRGTWQQFFRESFARVDRAFFAHFESAAGVLAPLPHEPAAALDGTDAPVRGRPIDRDSGASTREWVDPADSGFESITDWLIADRESRGLSRADLAARMGRSKSGVASVELGRKRVTVDYLREYAAVVGIPERVLTSAVARLEPRLVNFFGDSVPQPTDDRFRTTGEWLVALRELHGWTAKEAAGRIGVDATTLRRTEKGQQRITANHLRAVGTAYELPTGVLRAAAVRFAPELVDYLADSLPEPTDTRYRTLNMWLTAVRKQHDWTTGQLADRMGVWVGTVREVEAGGTVTQDYLRAFAAAFSVPDETLRLAERRFTTPDPLEFESIGDWLRAVRERHDLDQAQLGALMDRHRTAVSMVENGRRRPGLGYLRDVIDALGTPDAEILSAALYFDLPLADHFRESIPDPTEPEFRTLGDWLRAVREHHQWTQKALGARMGRGDEAVLKAERDIAVTRNHLRDFGKALRIPRATLHAATLRLAPHLADAFSAAAPDPRDLRFETIGDWLAAVRHHRTWTQQELADRASLTRLRVLRAEHSESLPDELSRHIADVLGIPEQIIEIAQRRFTVPDPADPSFGTLGDWLRANRERFGWSRQELADRINDHRVAIWDAEATNRPIGPRLLRDLRAALGIPIETMQQAVLRFAPELQDYFGTSLPRARDRTSVAKWVTAVRRHHGLTKKDLATRMERHPRTVADVENGGRATLDFLRRLRDSIGMPSEALREAIEQFSVPGDSEERPEDALFWQLIDTPVGSSDETRIRNSIFEQFDWIAIAAARRWYSRQESADDLTQRFRESLFGAIRNHVPGGPPFAAHAWRSARGAMLSSYFESRFPNLDRPTRLQVVRVYTFFNRHVAQTGSRPDVDQMAEALDLTPAEVRNAQQLITGKTVSLNANQARQGRPLEVADPTLATADVEFTTTVRAALQNLPDPATAELVVGALIQGLSPGEVEAQLNISKETFQQLTLEVSAVLRTVFTRPTEANQDDEDQPGAASDSIGSRPSEDAARRPSPNNDPSAAAVPVAHIRTHLAELRAAEQANTPATERIRQLTEFANAVEEMESAAAAMARTRADADAEARWQSALSTVSSIVATVEAAARDTARHDEAVRMLARLGGAVVGQVHLVYAALFEHMRDAGQYVDEVDDTDEHEFARSARQYESLVKQIDWLDALITVLEHSSPKDRSQQYRSLIDTNPRDPDPRPLDLAALQSWLMREATGSADRSTELEQRAAAAVIRHRAALAAVGELDRLLIPTDPRGPVDTEQPSTVTDARASSVTAPAESMPTADPAATPQRTDGRAHREVDLGHAAGVTDIGGKSADQRHRRNQDAFAIATATVSGERMTLAIVTDGVSHSTGAELAAQVGSEAAAEVLARRAAAAEAGAGWDPVAVVTEAVEAAQQAVLDLIATEEFAATSDADSPKATIVVALVTPTQVITDSRGDARVMWISLDDSASRELAEPDTYVPQYMEMFGITEREAMGRPEADKPLTGLGNGWQREWQPPQPQVFEPTGPGIVGLFTDGPIKHLAGSPSNPRTTAESIAETVARHFTRSGTLLGAAQAFIQGAIAAKQTNDNLTAVLLEGPADAIGARPDRTTGRIGARPSRTEYDGAEISRQYHPEVDEFWRRRRVEVIVLDEDDDGSFIGPDKKKLTTGRGQHCFLILRSGKIVTTKDGSAEHPILLHSYMSTHADENEKRIHQRIEGPSIVAGGGFWHLVDGRPEMIGFFSGMILAHATKTPRFWAQARHRLSRNFDLSNIFIQSDDEHIGGAWQNPPENTEESSVETFTRASVTALDLPALENKVAQHLRGGNEEFWFEVETVEFPPEGGMSIDAIIHPVLGEPAEVTIEIGRGGGPATAHYGRFDPGPEPARTIPAFRAVHDVLTQWISASGIAWSDDAAFAAVAGSDDAIGARPDRTPGDRDDTATPSPAREQPRPNRSRHIGARPTRSELPDDAQAAYPRPAGARWSANTVTQADRPVSDGPEAASPASADMRTRFGDSIRQQAATAVDNQIDLGKLTLTAAGRGRLLDEIAEDIMVAAGQILTSGPPTDAHIVAAIAGARIHEYLRFARFRQGIRTALRDEVRSGPLGQQLAGLSPAELEGRLDRLARSRPDQQRCLVLRHRNGLSVRATARTMGVGVDTVHTLESRGALSIAGAPIVEAVADTEPEPEPARTRRPTADPLALLKVTAAFQHGRAAAGTGDTTAIDALTATIEQLDNPHHRQALKLRFVQDMAIPQIAASLDQPRSVGATKQLLRRAVRVLAQQLDAADRGLKVPAPARNAALVAPEGIRSILGPLARRFRFSKNGRVVFLGGSMVQAEVESFLGKFLALQPQLAALGAQPWFTATQLRIRQTLAKAPLARYYNSYNAPSITDSTDPAAPLQGIRASVEPDGTLRSTVLRSEHTPPGHQMFDDMWAAIGHHVRRIAGQWEPNEVLHGNLNTFDQLLQQGHSPQEAAFGTWTGKMARHLGFTEVTVEVDSDNRSVWALFTNRITDPTGAPDDEASHVTHEARARPGSFKVPDGVAFTMDAFAHLVDRQRGLFFGVDPDSSGSAGTPSRASFTEYAHVPTGELARQIQSVGDSAHERIRRLRIVRDELIAEGGADALSLSEPRNTGTEVATSDLRRLERRINEEEVLTAAELRQALARAEQLAIAEITRSPNGVLRRGDLVEIFTRAEDYAAATEQAASIRRQGGPAVVRRLHIDLSGRIMVEELSDGSLAAPANQPTTAFPSSSPDDPTDPAIGARPRRSPWSRTNQQVADAQSTGITGQAEPTAGPSTDNPHPIPQLAAYFGADATEQTLVQTVNPDDVTGASTAHTEKVAQWWESLGDGAPQRTGLPQLQRELDLSDAQYEVFQAHSWYIGNADGIPYTVRDKANRLAIDQRIEQFLERRPGTRRRLRTSLTAAQRAELANLLRLRSQLPRIEAKAAGLTGRPKVQLVAFDPAAHGENGRVIIAIGDLDNAEIVNMIANGFGATTAVLYNRSGYALSLNEIAALRADGAPVATVAHIGYHCPTDASVAVPRKAAEGGDILACDTAGIHATRAHYARRPGHVPLPRLFNVVGHSYGSTTTCYAGQGRRLAGIIDQVILTGSPGIGWGIEHADDFGAPVWVLGDPDDPVAQLGNDAPYADRRKLGVGLGLAPTAAAFGATVLTTEVPAGRKFAMGFSDRLDRNLFKPHASYYLWRDWPGRVPARGLDNIGWVLVGRGDRAEVRDPHGADRPGWIRARAADRFGSSDHTDNTGGPLQAPIHPGSDDPIGSAPTNVPLDPFDAAQVVELVSSASSAPVQWQPVAQVHDDELLAAAAATDIDLAAIRRRWEVIATDYPRSGWRTGGGLLFRGDERPHTVALAEGFVPLQQRDGRVVYTTVRVNRAADYGESVKMNDRTSQWSVVHQIFVIDAPGGFGVVDEFDGVVAVHWPGGLRSERIVGCFEIPAEIWQGDFAALADELRQYWRPNPRYQPHDAPIATEVMPTAADSVDETARPQSDSDENTDPPARRDQSQGKSIPQPAPTSPSDRGRQDDNPIGYRPRHGPAESRWAIGSPQDSSRNAADEPQLSEDHLRVLRWITDGWDNARITEALRGQQASKYVGEVASALGIANKRYLIAAEATRRGLVQPRSPLADLGKRLTPRQIVVLAHLSRGRTRGEIATMFGISSRTVDKHVNRALPDIGSPTLVTAMPRIVGALDTFDKEALARLAASISDTTAGRSRDETLAQRLSPTEAAVLRQVRQGRTHTEIAAESGMSAHEVRRVLADARRKVGDSDRSRLAALHAEERAHKSKNAAAPTRAGKTSVPNEPAPAPRQDGNTSRPGTVTGPTAPLSPAADQPRTTNRGQTPDPAVQSPWSRAKSGTPGDAPTASLPDQSTGLPRSDSIGARPRSEDPGSGSNDHEAHRAAAAAAGPLALLSAARAGDETAREQLWQRFSRDIAMRVSAGAMADRPDRRELVGQVLRGVFDLAFDPEGPAAPVRDVEAWLRAIARDVVDRMVFRHVCAGVATVLQGRGMESSPAYRLLVDPIPAEAAQQAMAALAGTRYDRWLRQSFWTGGNPADVANLPLFNQAAVRQLLRVVAEAVGKDVPAISEEPDSYPADAALDQNDDATHTPQADPADPLGDISERTDEGSDSDAAPPSPALLRVALLRDPDLVIPHFASLPGPEALYAELHFGYGWPTGKIAASTGDTESSVRGGLEHIAHLSVGKLPSEMVASYQDVRPDHAFTIEDLAREAGTSPAEADDALNGSPGVGPETRQKVFAAADRLRSHREVLCAFMFHDRQASWGLDGRVLAAATTSELESAIGRLGVLEQQVIESRFEELRSVAETAARLGMAESVVRVLERTAVRGLVEGLAAVVDPAVAREFGAPVAGVRFAAFEAVVRLRRLERDYPGVLQPSEFAEAAQAPYSAVRLINQVHGIVSNGEDSAGAPSRALAILRAALRDPDPAIPHFPGLAEPEALYAELYFGYGWPVDKVATSTGADQESVYDRLARFAELSVAKLPLEIVARHRVAGAHRTPTTANLAGKVETSPAGISRALNGTPGVGPEMRQKVFAAADRLGYQRSDFVLLRRELLCAFMFHDRQASWGLDGRVLAAATKDELHGAIGRLGETAHRVIESRFEELRSVAETAARLGMAESVVRVLERTAVRGLVEGLAAVVDPAVAREFGAPVAGVRFAAFEAVVRLRRLERDYPGVLQPSEFAEAAQAPYSAVRLINQVHGSDSAAGDGTGTRTGYVASAPRGTVSIDGLPGSELEVPGEALYFRPNATGKMTLHRPEEVLDSSRLVRQRDHIVAGVVTAAIMSAGSDSEVSLELGAVEVPGSFHPNIEQALGGPTLLHLRHGNLSVECKLWYRIFDSGRIEALVFYKNVPDTADTDFRTVTRAIDAAFRSRFPGSSIDVEEYRDDGTDFRRRQIRPEGAIPRRTEWHAVEDADGRRLHRTGLTVSSAADSDSARARGARDAADWVFEMLGECGWGDPDRVGAAEDATFDLVADALSTSRGEVTVTMTVTDRTSPVLVEVTGTADVETPPDKGAAHPASEPRIPARPTPWSGAAQRIFDAW